EVLAPNALEWVFVALYVVVFIVGITGNLLVCIVVCTEKWMRTVTNLFIVNLALADFLVILVCLVPSVITNLTKTWYFGETMCKMLVTLQLMSISVSVLTLSAIAVERYYAICHPLKFQATIKRTKLFILLIWIVSIIVAMPEYITVDT
ncbi:hypothetical protein HELRODRAFT_144094, partial [Helobdella robusta]|uniref:G-protein coupled receptors family 1 profile domain-containing protein n=1 Tax=Helobdella robusta TaxID=6412 RepID=T1EJD6_HELRO